MHHDAGDQALLSQISLAEQTVGIYSVDLTRTQGAPLSLKNETKSNGKPIRGSHRPGPSRKNARTVRALSVFPLEFSKVGAAGKWEVLRWPRCELFQPSKTGTVGRSLKIPINNPSGHVAPLIKDGLFPRP